VGGGVGFSLEYAREIFVFSSGILVVLKTKIDKHFRKIKKILL